MSRTIPFFLLSLLFLAGCSPPPRTVPPPEPAPAPAAGDVPRRQSQVEIFLQGLDQLRQGQTTLLEDMTRSGEAPPWKDRALWILDLHRQQDESTRQMGDLRQQLETCRADGADLEKSNETLLHDLEELKKILVETETRNP